MGLQDSYVKGLTIGHFGCPIALLCEDAVRSAIGYVNSNGRIKNGSRATLGYAEGVRMDHAALLNRNSNYDALNSPSSTFWPKVTVPISVSSICLSLAHKTVRKGTRVPWAAL